MSEMVQGTGDKEMEAEERGDEESEAFESRRLQIFRATVESVVKKAAYSVSSEKIAEIAENVSVDHTLTRHQKKSLTSSCSKFQKLLNDIMKNDIDEYLSSSGLLKVFDTMSEMCPENNSGSSAIWRPTGSPQQDMRSHEAEKQIQHNELLQGKIEEQEAEIQSLKQNISHRRLQTQNLLKKMQHLRRDCTAAYAGDSALLLHMSNSLSKEV